MHMDGIGGEVLAAQASNCRCHGHLVPKPRGARRHHHLHTSTIHFFASNPHKRNRLRVAAQESPITAVTLTLITSPTFMREIYRIGRCILQYYTPLGAVFQGRLPDKQERANTKRTVFGKLSATCFHRRPFWHRHYSSCGDTEHGRSAQWGVIYAVVHGTRKQCGTTFAA